MRKRKNPVIDGFDLMGELDASLRNRWTIMALMMVIIRDSSRDETFVDAAAMAHSLVTSPSIIKYYMSWYEDYAYDLPWADQAAGGRTVSQHHRLPIPKGLTNLNWDALAPKQFDLLMDTFTEDSYTPAEVRKALKGLVPLSYDASYLKHFPALSVVWKY